MPGKSIRGKVKPRKKIDSVGGLWIAPRSASHKSPEVSPRTYEPVTGDRLNRYLEFADIALGVKQPGSKRKAAKAGVSPAGEKPGPKLVSINHAGAKRGFGAFRNSR